MNGNKIYIILRINPYTTSIIGTFSNIISVMKEIEKDKQKNTDSGKYYIYKTEIDEPFSYDDLVKTVE